LYASTFSSISATVGCVAPEAADPANQFYQDGRVGRPRAVGFYRGAVDEALLKIIQSAIEDITQLHLMNLATGRIAHRDVGLVFVISLLGSDSLHVLAERPHGSSGSQPDRPARKNFFGRFYRGFNRGFEVFREGYRDFLSICLRHSGATALTFIGFSILSMCLLPLLGQNFFPSVDAGQFDLHVRVRSGTRIEETARQVDLIEKMIRQVIPSNQLTGIIDNEGIPYSGINTSYNTTGTVSSADGDILVSLNKGHEPTDKFIRLIRQRLHHDFPDVTYWFPADDIVSQVLNWATGSD
jgi:AcrB/AcrD/AcrF family